MDVNQFISNRRPDWERLGRLLDKGKRDMRALQPDDVERLGQLYRAATSDLALAQRDWPRHQVTRYLNQLVARGHTVIYQTEPLALQRIWRFARAGFPRHFRRSLPFFGLATLLFVLASLAAGLVTYLQPEMGYVVLPAGVHELIPLIEDQTLWTDIPIAERPYAASFIMTNNIRVTFLAFGGGMLAGLLTVYVMLLNGLLLGGITGLTAHYGVGFELWTFVIGHGVIELSMIFIAGGAGLMVGWAILHPGLQRRQDAIAQAAGRAVRLLIGCVPLLVLAGFIEGFISPNEVIPWPIKWGVGLGSGVVVYGYLLFAGR